MLTAQSESGHLISMLMRHPRDAFIDQATIDRQWRRLNYHAAPDFSEACAEFDLLIETLEPLVDRIQLLPTDNSSLDSLYVRDASVVCDQGLVLCRMGKNSRREEPERLAAWLASENATTLGSIAGEGRLEGGDLVWLDRRTIAVGLGYRSNRSGHEQLAELLGGEIVLLAVPLPHWNGPADVLHLMSLISPLDIDLALVYSRLLPVCFREYLLSRSIELIEVDDDEYLTLACNVLALGPRQCLMVKGNPATRRKLEMAGCNVIEFKGDEICRKGEGGPTCLTRPLLREC